MTGILCIGVYYMSIAIIQPIYAQILNPQTCNVAASCPTGLSSGPSYQYNGACYVLLNRVNNWNLSNADCSSGALVWFNTTMDYGRAAVFETDADLANVAQSLLALAKGQTVPNGYSQPMTLNGLVWLGAKTPADGSYLSNYCWTTRKGGEQAGAFVTPFPTRVNASSKSSSGLTGLAIDLSEPTVFYGFDVTKNNLYMICEFGCGSSNYSCSGSTSMTQPCFPEFGACSVGGNITVSNGLTTRISSTSTTAGVGQLTTSGITTSRTSTGNITASCPTSWSQGPSYLYNNKCYVLLNHLNAWSISYSDCSNGVSNWFNTPMTYGRAAVFATETDLINVALNLRTLATGSSVPNGYPQIVTVNNLVWLGAQTASTGTYLSNYCWMTESPGIQKGPQVSNISTPVNVSVGSQQSVYGLAIDLSNPTVFYGLDSSTPNLFMICEYGCDSNYFSCPGVAPKQAMCNPNNGVCALSGASNTLGNKSSSTTVSTTPSYSTSSSAAPSTFSKATTSTMSRTTSTTSGATGSTTGSTTSPAKTWTSSAWSQNSTAATTAVASISAISISSVPNITITVPMPSMNIYNANVSVSLPANVSSSTVITQIPGNTMTSARSNATLIYTTGRSTKISTTSATSPMSSASAATSTIPNASISSVASATSGISTINLPSSVIGASALPTTTLKTTSTLTSASTTTWTNLTTNSDPTNYPTKTSSILETSPSLAVSDTTRLPNVTTFTATGTIDSSASPTASNISNSSLASAATTAQVTPTKTIQNTLNTSAIHTGTTFISTDSSILETISTATMSSSATATSITISAVASTSTPNTLVTITPGHFSTTTTITDYATSTSTMTTTKADETGTGGPGSKKTKSGPIPAVVTTTVPQPGNLATFATQNGLTSSPAISSSASVMAAVGILSGSPLPQMSSMPPVTNQATAFSPLSVVIPSQGVVGATTTMSTLGSPTIAGTVTSLPSSPQSTAPTFSPSVSSSQKVAVVAISTAEALSTPSTPTTAMGMSSSAMTKYFTSVKTATPRTTQASPSSSASNSGDPTKLSIAMESATGSEATSVTSSLTTLAISYPMTVQSTTTRLPATLATVTGSDVWTVTNQPSADGLSGASLTTSETIRMTTSAAITGETLIQSSSPTLHSVNETQNTTGNGNSAVFTIASRSEPATEGPTTIGNTESILSFTTPAMSAQGSIHAVTSPVITTSSNNGTSVTSRSLVSTAAQTASAYADTNPMTITNPGPDVDISQPNITPRVTIAASELSPPMSSGPAITLHADDSSFESMTADTAANSGSTMAGGQVTKSPQLSDANLTPSTTTRMTTGSATQRRELEQQTEYTTQVPQTILSAEMGGTSNSSQQQLSGSSSAQYTQWQTSIHQETAEQDEVDQIATGQFISHQSGGDTYSSAINADASSFKSEAAGTTAISAVSMADDQLHGSNQSQIGFVSAVSISSSLTVKTDGQDTASTKSDTVALTYRLSTSPSPKQEIPSTAEMINNSATAVAGPHAKTSSGLAQSDNTPFNLTESASVTSFASIPNNPAGSSADFFDPTNARLMQLVSTPSRVKDSVLSLAANFNNPAESNVLSAKLSTGDLTAFYPGAMSVAPNKLASNPSELSFTKTALPLMSIATQPTVLYAYAAALETIAGAVGTLQSPATGNLVDSSSTNKTGATIPDNAITFAQNISQTYYKPEQVTIDQKAVDESAVRDITVGMGNAAGTIFQGAFQGRSQQTANPQSDYGGSNAVANTSITSNSQVIKEAQFPNVQPTADGSVQVAAGSKLNSGSSPTVPAADADAMKSASNPGATAQNPANLEMLVPFVTPDNKPLARTDYELHNESDSTASYDQGEAHALATGGAPPSELIASGTLVSPPAQLQRVTLSALQQQEQPPQHAIASAPTPVHMDSHSASMLNLIAPSAPTPPAPDVVTLADEDQGSDIPARNSTEKISQNKPKPTWKPNKHALSPSMPAADITAGSSVEHQVDKAEFTLAKPMHEYHTHGDDSPTRPLFTGVDPLYKTTPAAVVPSGSQDSPPDAVGPPASFATVPAVTQAIAAPKSASSGSFSAAVPSAQQQSIISFSNTEPYEKAGGRQGTPASPAAIVTIGLATIGSNLVLSSNSPWTSTIMYLNNMNTTAPDYCHLTEWGPFTACGPACSVPSRIRNRTCFYLSRGSLSGDTYYDTVPCEGQCSPMSPQAETAVRYLMNIGCTWILAALGCSIIACIALRSKNYLQLIHLNEDLSLLGAHLLILLFAKRDDSTFNQTICNVAAIGLQYFFTATYTFQFLEALHIYTILTNVVLGNKAWLRLSAAIVAGWTIPAIITAATAASSYNSLISEYSCWLNVGSLVYFATFIPVILIGWPTLIMLEATGHFQSNSKSDIVNSCRYSRAGLGLVFITQFASWFLGSSAVYYQQISLYSFVFGLNVVLGIFICIYHTFANEKARLHASNLHSKVMHSIDFDNAFR